MMSKNDRNKFNINFNSEEFKIELNEFISYLKSGKFPENADHWVDKLNELNTFLTQNSNNELNSADYNNPLSSNNSNPINVDILNETQVSLHKSEDLARMLIGILDTLSEGYIIINREGRCGNFLSHQAKKFFNKAPHGDHLADIIDLPEENRDSFEDWLNMIFLEILSFDELAKLAPKGFKLKNSNKHVKASFKPIRNQETNKISEIVMVITDPNQETKTEKELGEQKIFTDMVIKYLNNKSNFIKIIHRTRETADTFKSWTFNDSLDFRIQASNLAKELNQLKRDLNENCIYSLGYKLHQAEDEIITFFDVSSNSQDGENLIHLIGQEIHESLIEFLNKYRHVFVFDNKTTAIKEIPVESIYKFCAELLRMGLTDLLKYYVDEIVAVPLVSLFAPIEAKVYSQSLSLDRNIDFNIIDYKKIKIIPEFYSLLFNELGHTINSIITLKKNPDLIVSKFNITLDLNKTNNDSHLNFSIEVDKSFKLINIEKSEFLENEINLFKLETVLNEMGGKLLVNSSDSSPFTQFSFIIPYVSELNSDVMDWLNTNSNKTGMTLLGTG